LILSWPFVTRRDKFVYVLYVASYEKKRENKVKWRRGKVNHKFDQKVANYYFCQNHAIIWTRFAFCTSYWVRSNALCLYTRGRVSDTVVLSAPHKRHLWMRKEHTYVFIVTNDCAMYTRAFTEPASCLPTSLSVIWNTNVEYVFSAMNLHTWSVPYHISWNKYCTHWIQTVLSAVRTYNE